METIRVRFLRGTSLGGGIDAAIGDVIDIDRRLYAQFVQQSRVEIVLDATATTTATPATAAETNAADAPKPKRKAK